VVAARVLLKQLVCRGAARAEGIAFQFNHQRRRDHWRRPLMTTRLRTRIGIGAVCFLALFLSLSAPVPAFSQVPGLPAPVQSAQPKAASGSKAAVPAEKTKSAVASASGPITVHQQISDQTLRRFLSRFLPKYPGIRHIDIAVDDGVVTLTGQVSD